LYYEEGDSQSSETLEIQEHLKSIN